MAVENPLLGDPFPRSVFVTGTGTDVGKTVACALLCRLWEAEYWKPVQAGTALQDMSEIVRLVPVVSVHLSRVTLDEPASPHLAARREGVEITVADLVENAPEGWSLVVEGAGGALVPINDRESMADLCKALDLPAVVVASTGLGTIHHTLSTLEALRARGCGISGVLLQGDAHGENARQIRDRGNVAILGRIPRMYPLDSQAVADLARRWAEEPWRDPCEEDTPCALPIIPSRSLVERDAEVVWHPYTQHQTMDAPLEIVRAYGASLFTAQGEEVLDAVSSWWVCNHGHGHPKIAEAISTQARSLEQVIFAGCTHDPAVSLSESLLACVPGNQGRIFFSDNGSTAVEVALKACVQTAVRRGIRKPRIGALAEAYHGDTFGAMALGERSVFSSAFESLLFEVDRLPSPAGCWDPRSRSAEAATENALEALRGWLDRLGDEVACVIVEPLVQGAGGMKMFPRSYLEGLDRLCQEHGVPWIADEVFTGFGRTGPLFATSDVPGAPSLHPSAVCMSKGLTGGFLPMGVTSFSRDIFDRFLSPSRGDAFFHGHSFTGNPLGCAAALASLELSLSAESIRSRLQLEQWHRRGLGSLERQGLIEGLRVTGTIAAFELPGAPRGYLATRGQEVAKACLDRGVLLRPLGDTLYLVPPFCLRETQYDRILNALEQALGTPGA
ncbi:MAG: adenosylmethionine--8-amino-7-oxononanoate transaminase [Fibrobacteria bacterium]|nr:adenosylmethionine--8-amino-7-oxononanoate transaminase [Fibrobacteria bacterium]